MLLLDVHARVLGEKSYKWGIDPPIPGSDAYGLTSVQGARKVADEYKKKKKKKNCGKSEVRRRLCRAA